MNKYQTKEKQNKGITLIALVITIIVLLILAGVSIAILTGENGIITKAHTAKEKTQKSTEEEQRQLAMLNAAMHTRKWYYTEKSGTTIPIPEGFAPTEIEGENSIKDGLVITDEDGNEFVWIQCTEDEYKDATFKSNWPSEGYTDKVWTDAQTEIGRESIKNNGGFYVGRYEAGVSDKSLFYASKEGDKYYTQEVGEDGITKNTDIDKPVSKKGAQSWNFINQINAETVSKKMINNSSVQSYLIDSHAWNTICEVIQTKTNKSITNSTDWGNYYNNTKTDYESINSLYALHTYNNSKWTYAETYYKGQVKGAPRGKGANRLELATGMCEDFKAYNIYDMAGNMWEWTTEIGTVSTDTKTYAVPRGGCLNNGGNNWPVVRANGINTVTSYYFGIGFRVVLYIK